MRLYQLSEENLDKLKVFQLGILLLEMLFYLLLDLQSQLIALSLVLTVLLSYKKVLILMLA